MCVHTKCENSSKRAEAVAVEMPFYPLQAKAGLSDSGNKG